MQDRQTYSSECHEYELEGGWSHQHTPESLTCHKNTHREAVRGGMKREDEWIRVLVVIVKTGVKMADGRVGMPCAIVDWKQLSELPQ